MDDSNRSEIIFSIVLVVRNERECLIDLLDDLTLQDFPPEQTEIILVDSASTDGTGEVMGDFARHNSGRRITMLQNPNRLLASGWNLAIKAATGRYVLRLDAHTRIPRDFLIRNLKALRRGETIVGGRIVYGQPENIWKLILSTAASSRFGAASAAFRQLGEARYVDTLAFAAYSRNIFGKVGLFNEALARTEDNEMHYRIRKAGFKFYYDSNIVSYYISRPTLRQLLKQMYSNGYWIFPTMMVQPKCFSLRHFVPFVFILGLIFACAVASISNGLILMFMLGIYFLAAYAFAARTLSNFVGYRKAAVFLMPLCFFMIHTAYGFGTCAGMTRIVWEYLDGLTTGADTSAIKQNLVSLLIRNRN